MGTSTLFRSILCMCLTILNLFHDRTLLCPFAWLQPFMLGMFDAYEVNLRAANQQSRMASSTMSNSPAPYLSVPFLFFNFQISL